MTETLNTARFEKLVGRYSVARDRARWAEQRLARTTEPLEASRLPKRVRAIEEWNGRAEERRVLTTLIEEERRAVLREVRACEQTMRFTIEELVRGGMPEKTWVICGDRAVALHGCAEGLRLADIPREEAEQAPPFQSFDVTVRYGQMRDRWQRQSAAERLAERAGTLTVLGLPAFVLALTGLFVGGPGLVALAGCLAVLLVAVAVGELFCGPREFLAFTGLPEQGNHGDRTESRSRAIDE